MKVYVFGNEDYALDAVGLEVMRRIQKSEFRSQNLEFVVVKPNEDLPFVGEEEVFILDVVQGLPGVRLIEGESLERIVMAPRSSAHEYDLGFQIRYLQKLGKLGRVRIIGIPLGKSATEVMEEVGLLLKKMSLKNDSDL